MSGFTPVLLLQTPGTLCRGPSRGALAYEELGPDPLQRLASCDHNQEQATRQRLRTKDRQPAGVDAYLLSPEPVLFSREFELIGLNNAIMHIYNCKWSDQHAYAVQTKLKWSEAASERLQQQADPAQTT